MVYTNPMNGIKSEGIHQRIQDNVLDALLIPKQWVH